MKTHALTGDVYQVIVDFIDAGRAFAVATVLYDAGSTPRKAGTKALLDAEGSIWGTIGGGLFEARARELAGNAIRSGHAVVFDFQFTGTSAEEYSPVCGGKMRVLIDPAAARHRGAYASAARARRERKRGQLVTRVDHATPPRVRIDWCAPTETCTQPADALIEVVEPSPLLVIVGGGHVGQALARHADLAGFELVVVEDRAEFARPELFPAGATVHCGDPAEIVRRMPIDADTYIAIVSRGHLTDAQTLAACIRSPAAYLGMMGSRRKVALVRKQFLESALATPEEFDRVHAPIGLDIGAETVPEIAASIVAELIAARRQPQVTAAEHGEARP